MIRKLLARTNTTMQSIRTTRSMLVRKPNCTCLRGLPLVVWQPDHGCEPKRPTASHTGGRRHPLPLHDTSEWILERIQRQRRVALRAAQVEKPSR
jgi:hypothetical protein